MIIGTVQNQVKLQTLEAKWQLKKSNSGKQKKVELTAEERQLRMYQEQAASVRESNKYAEIDAKIKSGATLSSEEIEYLRQHNPSALKAYEEAKQEKENYKNELKNCRTKEDVERLKLQKMGCFMAAAKKIENNPYIPKGQKLGMLSKILSEVTNVSEAHIEFTQSQAYRNLPTEEEERERRENQTPAMPEQQGEADMIVEQTKEPEEENMVPVERGAADATEATVELKHESRDTDASPEMSTEVSFAQIEQSIREFLKKDNDGSRNVDVSV